MAETLDDLTVRLLGDGKSYETMMQSAQGSLNKFSGSIGGASGQIQGITSSLTSFGGVAQGVIGMLAGGLGIGGFLATVQTAITKAGQRESTELAFEALIGNATLAQKTLEKLRDFAVKTPFEVPQILNAAKMMLGYGSTAEEIVPTMQKLGDVASALNIPMQSLAYLYGTLKSSGRVMTVDMRQFANRGIPIWLETAKAIGMVSKDTRALTQAQSAQLQQMVSKGKINFDIIEKAFTNMTAKGGQFFGFMEKQSTGFEGLISNLKDSLGLLMEEMGTEIIKGFDLKRIILEVRNLAQAFVEWFQGMNPNMKKAMFVIAAVVAGLSVLVGAVLTGIAIFKVLGAVIAAVGWPFLIVAGLIIGAIAAWVNSVGGVSKALDIVKAKLLKIWETTRPLRQQLAGLAETLWNAFQQVFGLILKTATDTWTSITGDGQINWDKIVESAADMVVRIEYEILKLQKAFWGFFTWLGEQIGTFMAKVEYALKEVELLEKKMERLNKMAGGRGMFTVGGAGMALFGPGNQKELPQVLRDLPATFEEFLAQRKKLRVKPDDIITKKDQDDLKKKGEETGKGIARGMKKGLKDLDDVLFGSAENLRRLAQYMEALKEPMQKAAAEAIGAGAPVAPVPGRVPGQPQHGAPAPKVAVQLPEPWGMQNDKVNGLLEMILNKLPDKNGLPPVEVEGAEVNLR